MNRTKTKGSDVIAAALAEAEKRMELADVLIFGTNFPDPSEMTADEMAEAYLSLQEKMAPLTQRLSELKDAVKALAPKNEWKELEGGNRIKLSVAPYEHFDTKTFKEKEPNKYNEYMDCRVRERLYIERIKTTRTTKRGK